MVSALADHPSVLPLLITPDKPPVGRHSTVGWRWKAGSRSKILERRYQDDAQGAIVQWIVLRYYRDGVQRQDLAREYGYSPRRVQEYLSGTGTNLPRRPGFWWSAYSAPVLRALDRIGIPVGGRSGERKRADVQIAACRAALTGVADLLATDERPAARRLRRDIALLTVAAAS